MTVQLNQSSYGGAPHLANIQIDDDGRVTGAQTSGYRVGRFARTLSSRERGTLTRALTSAKEPTHPHRRIRTARFDRAGRRRNSSATDCRISVSPPMRSPAGFEKLVRLLLKLRGTLPESPVAAIELEVDGAPLSARLRQVGSEPVAVRFGTLQLQATLFGPDSATIDSTSHTVDGSAVDGSVDPGWTFPLVDDLGIARPAKGQFLTVSVRAPEVDILGNGVLGPAEFSWILE